MGRRKAKPSIKIEDAVNFLNHLMMEKTSLVLLIPLVFMFWVIERWIFSFSSWLPLVVTVWATVQYGNYQRRILLDDVNKKWKKIVSNSSPITPLEHCEWLNKLFIEVWPNFMNPKLSIKFASLVEKRLKQRKSGLIEKIELQEFSLGASSPSLGLNGIRWSTTGDQRVMHLNFDWDTSDISILLLAKLAKPFMGTARIVINNLQIKGDLVLMPILDGKSFLYSFVSTPEVRIGVAFGSGGSQYLPATELPGVSSWLVKTLTDTLVRTMVEPRRRCYSLPAVDLRKEAVNGVIYVTVISASKLYRSGLKGSSSGRQSVNGSVHGSVHGNVEDEFDDKDLKTFVEVELGELTRRTSQKQGSSPRWNSTFNMVLHESTGCLRFNLYEYTPSSIKYDYLASCEVKVKYVADDSTTFWAIGPDSGVIAKHASFCGEEVEMVVPFEGVSSGELTVRLVLKEWHFSDGSHSFNARLSSRKSINGSSNFLSNTGRKINVTILEGKDLIAKDKSGKCDAYVKLQYGKTLRKTKTVSSVNSVWNQIFEFDEIGGGEYLKIRCFSEDMLGDDSIGSARVNLEGLVEGSVRDIWVPLEKVNSGELRIQIEAVNVSESERTGSGNGLIELVLVEGRDLIAADLRGTSDPYVRVQYGNLKRRTKVMYRTLTPKWNQTLEFPDDGSPLELHVKDHNAVLPTSSIGDCVVEYQSLLPNETSDKWIPLQGVKRGEIHVQVTRKVPQQVKKHSMNSLSASTKARIISSQMKDMMIKLEGLIEEGNVEGLSTALSELESLEEVQEEYLAQLETEQSLLLNKISEIGQEILSSHPSLTRISSAN